MKLANSGSRASLALVLFTFTILATAVWSSPGVFAQDKEDPGPAAPAAAAQEPAAADSEKPAAGDAEKPGPAEPAAAPSESGDKPSEETESLVFYCWLFALAGSVIALVFARKFYVWMMAQDEGNERMIEIAQAVRDGADAYLKRQYFVVGVFFAIAWAVLMFVSLGLDAQHPLVPWAFLTGGAFSGLAGWFGMKTATWASSRTTQGAQNSLNEGLQVAFRSGAVMGFTVVGLGLLDICLWFGALYYLQDTIGFEMSLAEITVTMLCFGMGASAQALFARVGGGIFTKAADVGADLVGKVEAGIPEDDPRNPATIADNVGDNVGDVAGMGADLYESYCGSILASAALGVAAFAGVGEGLGIDYQLKALMLPLLLAAVGIGLSIWGVYLVKTKEDTSQKNLLKALGKGINYSSVAVAIAAFALVKFLLPEHIGLFVSVSVGLLAGWLIGWWTEYSTSDEYAPTQAIAKQAESGPATIIIAGVAEGLYSVWVPIVVIGVAILLAFGFSTEFAFGDASKFAMGLYGVGLGAVGMLSTLGLTLATDAYGPIADNAGGNAEMAGLDPVVRERTDALDSLGNTTAATGKGFAIGSAALTALALLAAYVEEVRVGYERWAKAEVVEVADGTLIKLNKRALAVKHGEDVETYLVMPAGASQASKDFVKAINDSENGEQVSIDDLPAAVTMGFLISNETATIPDFVRLYDVSVMNPAVLIGMFMGVMLAFVFCAMTMKAVGRAADGMVQEVRRQFAENPGILEGTTKPDYANCVSISTRAAQKEMVLPSLLGLAVPILVGMVLGVGGVMGMLAGGLTSGFAVAIFMANAGGAWDNAKKYIEAGHFGGKGSDAHKAGVVGDTVGDPFKDTSGPSLNILIKLMSMVSVVFAGLIVKYALGIF
ncbi:MAG: sodium-translocating pyrophosphatase [Planctomycetota bacterium]|nr:sodium-translocating pyrophosphatase [Planctomycetota bacterium]